MRHHGIQQLIIGQARSPKPRSLNGVPFSRSTDLAVTPIRSISCLRSARAGGVFKYSITCGSTPALRIMPSALREVPQSGLW